MPGSLFPGLNTIASAGVDGLYMSLHLANGTQAAPSLASSSFYWRCEQNQAGMWSIQDPNSGLFFGYDISAAPSHSTLIKAVENEVSWDIWPSSTTGNYQLFVHDTFLTPTLYGSTVGTTAYLANVTSNYNEFQTWEILGIGTTGILPLGPNIKGPTGIIQLGPIRKPTGATRQPTKWPTSTVPQHIQSATSHQVPPESSSIADTSSNGEHISFYKFALPTSQS